MIAPQDQTKRPAVPSSIGVAAGTSIRCEVRRASDMDHWEVLNTHGSVERQGDKADSIRYHWDDGGAGGTFANAFAASTTWKAPKAAGLYTLSCTIDDGGRVTRPQSGSRNDKPVIRSFRLVVDTTWSLLVKARRHNSGNVFSPNVKIAAGGILTPGGEHCADVHVIAIDGLGNHVSGVSVNKPAVSKKAGHSVDASITPETAVTDANGDASFLYRSSDRSQLVTLTATGGGSASVDQLWDDVQDHSDWQFDYYFLYDGPSVFSFLPAFLDGKTTVKITAHEIDFTVGNPDVWNYDSGTDCYILVGSDTAHAYLVGLMPSSSPDRGYGPDGKWKGYSTTLRVQYDDDYIVDYVYPGLEDDNSWAP